MPRKPKTKKCPECLATNPINSRFCRKCGFQISGSKKTYVSKTDTIQATVRELTTGITFAGRYQVIEELAKGGMGRVYKVYDKKINEKIALKLIKVETESDQEAIKRFKNELKLARKISHRNVCRMFDLGEEEGSNYITMEFVPGEDLKSSLVRMGPLSAAKAIFIGRQVCEGLAEAHGLGVVHRDLKPQNIMVDRKGNARIMDFGIARSLRAEGITDTGVVIGTAEYMSPEQVEGKEVDQRSDIYSLGVIMYEMVTGKVPFEGKIALTIALKHTTEKPKNPREINDQIPEDLSNVILKCMQKNKERRYQKAEELLAALDMIEKDFPTRELALPARKPIIKKNILKALKLKKIFVTALVLAGIAVAWLIFFSPRELSLDPQRIAVATFHNKTGDELLDPYGRVAADWITQALSRTDVVEIVPTSMVLQSSNEVGIKASGLDSITLLRALAEKTNTGTVIWGSYYLKDETLRFQIEITDSMKAKPVHSLEEVRGLRDSPMEVIETLRQRVLGTLVLYFDSIPSKILRAAKPPLYDAYREYIVGLEYFGKDYLQALHHFKLAVERDPEFLAPRARIAIIYGTLGEYAKADSEFGFINKYRAHLTRFEQNYLDWYMSRLKGNYAEALQYLRQAEKQAPNNIYVNYLIGLEALRNNNPQGTVNIFAAKEPSEYIYHHEARVWQFGVLAKAHHMLGNYQLELDEIRRGQESYPDKLELRVDEVRALAALGRIKEVTGVIEDSLSVKSRTATPGSVMLEAAQELRAHGFLNEAQEIANRAAEWHKNRALDDAESDVYRSDLAFSLYIAGQWEKANALFKELAEKNPDNVEYKGFLGRLAARGGDRKAALKISEELQQIKRPYLFGYHTYCRACIASLLGEREQAVELLSEAFAQGYAHGVYLHRDIDLEALREYPPFQELLWPKEQH
jgi:serine/threonine protein kinase/tetratricopeptide (TPR) repeat protein/ribosomal protein L40E